MLTDTQCRTAKAKEKPYKLTDGGGLVLEVKPNGVKAWRYRFELAGKESMFAIGEYATAPAGETPKEGEARDERTRPRAAGGSGQPGGVAGALQDKAPHLVRSQSQVGASAALRGIYAHARLNGTDKTDIS